jgi:hypothetical protein
MPGAAARPVRSVQVHPLRAALPSSSYGATLAQLDRMFRSQKIARTSLEMESASLAPRQMILPREAKQSIETNVLTSPNSRSVRQVGDSTIVLMILATTSATSSSEFDVPDEPGYAGVEATHLLDQV